MLPRTAARVGRGLEPMTAPTPPTQAFALAAGPDQTERAARALAAHAFSVEVLEDARAARARVAALLPAGAAVYTAASETLREGNADDPKLAALLGVVRQAAANRGRVDEATWLAARAAGWTEAHLAEAFALVGLTQHVDGFLNVARTEVDPALVQGAEDRTRLTFLLKEG